LALGARGRNDALVPDVAAVPPNNEKRMVVGLPSHAGSSGGDDRSYVRAMNDAQSALKPQTSHSADRPVGFFINLDRSAKRRRAVEAELAKARLARTHQRFAGTDGRVVKMRNHAVSPRAATVSNSDISRRVRAS
jgi:hypothetical protein